jgi:hypothetical protein
MPTILLSGFIVGAIFLNYFEEAEGLKSEGNSVKKFGSATKHLVCGDKLCSESKVLESESFQALESLVFFDCNHDAMCIINYLKEIDKKEGQNAVFSEFSKVISVLQKNTTYCHAPAHHLGKFLFEYTDDLKTATSIADSRCGGAIIHGLLQSFFEKSSNNSIDIEKIIPSKICTYYGGDFSRDRYECLHGLGHGLVIFYDYDIFKAIKYCGEFSEDWEINTCSNGIFMENIDNYLSGNEEMFEPDDIFYPCNKMDSKYASACFHHQNTFMLVKNNYSIPETFDDCDQITPEEYVKYCYRGMGRQLAPVSSSIEIPIEPAIKISNALEICQKGKVELNKDCLMGMLRVIIDQDSLDDGFEYCKLLPQQFKNNCYTLLGVWIEMLYDSQMDQITQCLKSENSNNFVICANSSIKDWELIQG